MAGTVRGFCVLFPHHTPLSHSFSLFGDLFVYQVLFAFGFGHQFFRWFSVSVWGQFSLRVCSVLFGKCLSCSMGFLLRGRRPSLRIFLFFSCASLRICLGKWCWVWFVFGFLFCFLFGIKWVFYFLRILFFIGGRLFLPFLPLLPLSKITF